MYICLFRRVFLLIIIWLLQWEKPEELTLYEQQQPSKQHPPVQSHPTGPSVQQSPQMQVQFQGPHHAQHNQTKPMQQVSQSSARPAFVYSAHYLRFEIYDGYSYSNVLNIFSTRFLYFQLSKDLRYQAWIFLSLEFMQDAHVVLCYYHEYALLSCFS